ncbi:unnamed protein product, partial [Rotaria socialis]
ASSLINIPPDANETLNKLINQLSSAATSNSAVATATTTITNPMPSINITSILQSTLLQSLTVFANALNSTPQSTISNNETSEKLTQALTTIATQLNQHQTPTTTNAAESFPEYRPTPIVELERRKQRVHHPIVKTNIKTEPIDFDSNEYVQATFSPPSNSPPQSAVDQPEPMEVIHPKVSTVAKSTLPISLQTIPKQSTTDDYHSWVTPPMRRKLSS